MLVWLWPLWGLSGAWASQSPSKPSYPIPPEEQTPVLNYCYQGRVPETRLVVVDKSRQRIMVFRYLGGLMLEYEYPCATGTNFGPKTREGDERTPVGIYFTTHRHTDRKITIFGDRAIHLNYPNPVDQVKGLKGNGIYIHGTKGRLKPRSTNGCVAMRNQDLAVLAKLIREHVTPVVVVERLRLADIRARNRACDLLQGLEKRPLAWAPARLSPSLAVAGVGRRYQKLLDGITARLAGFAGGPHRRFRVRTDGYILLGLGDQWVLVADQVMTGPGRRRARVIRRFYLQGDPLAPGALVRGDWVVPDLTTAKRLAAWAPPVAVAAAGTTPAKPKPTAAAPPSPEKQVVAVVRAWLKAWQSKNLRRYMAFYAPDFRSGRFDRRAWRRHKAYLNRVYKVIRVRVKDLKVEVSGNRARVSFIQYYRSDWHRDVGRKELVLVKRKGRWRIVSETWRELPRRAGGRRQPSRS